MSARGDSAGSGLRGIHHPPSRRSRGSRDNSTRVSGITPTRVTQARLGATGLLIDIHRLAAVLRSSRRAGITSVSIARSKEVSRGLRGQFGAPLASDITSGAGRAGADRIGKATATAVMGEIVGVHRMVVAAGWVARNTTASSLTATSTAIVPQVAVTNLLLELTSRAHITPIVVHFDIWARMTGAVRLE